MSKKLTEEKLQKLVEKSGFPFELKVSEYLSSIGFKIQPSYQFYDASREKDTEIDILATQNDQWDLKDGQTLTSILNLGIECKDNNLPLVCFGLEDKTEVKEDIFDGDCYYFHLRTSRDDGLPNKFSYPLFDNEYGGNKLKDEIHQFDTEHRNYFVGSVEQKGQKGRKYFKFHSTSAIQYAVSKLGAYAGNFHGYGNNQDHLIKDSRSLEQMGVNKGPVIILNCLLLIHSGNHFRYNLNNSGLQKETHTPIFLNRSYANNSISYIVDLIDFDNIEESINTVQESYEKIVRYLAKWVIAA